jgi:hypothetical protein
MPVSTTTRGRPMSRDRDIGRIAFCRTESIGAPKLVFAAQWLAYAIPCQRFASPRGSPRMTRGRCGSLHLHRRGLTWAFSGQVVRFIGTSKNSGGCFGIQGLSPIS